ncbi:hydroxyethylthiazole kinase [Caloramator quimbayensis]|uniref:Hydroxyethylthiazole kinase n=1 Tax=Caloramator quimbayensis TaxID=1147123 RepID=A0A1T4WM59_9CLOT|nr:hydroxyethylthiazole kinase [Caloramator quimbayensis]SKA78414.1 hydroxyethylthiazole kinase [Caloramator quimbayensis]
METCKKIGELLCSLREKNPLIHNITNYVTVNDCANITLAIGASPVMADDINEVKDMVSLASSLILNIGTLNKRTVESMIEAGKRANELNIPIILDPVGAGATKYRTENANRIIDEIKLSVVRGNISEIKTLYGLETQTKGVDASEPISSSRDELTEIKEIARNFAKKFNTICAITGATDIITDGKTIYSVTNGHKIMSKITGTGCMCTSLIGSYLGAADNYLLAALSGIVSMGIAGEKAFEKMNKNDEGTGSFKTYLIDSIYKLSKEEIIQRGKVYEE